jgi:hypothetical protein
MSSMWKLIAVVAITSLSLALTALPVYAACSSSQVDACTSTNNACADDCNFTGAPQSCYDACVCGYYACREGCGDGMIPEGCRSS